MVLLLLHENFRSCYQNLVKQCNSPVKLDSIRFIASSAIFGDVLWYILGSASSR